ncbi:unnamed protein product [Adineta steineri]|uniref:Uncharacterized protein n=1 Tax=Adineta steineri TaxID=433720 RepID=A0A813P8H8_9BILA|nr:unnamed protein product [Adineta steineri]CAF0739857.1 unnamed protein product [Adineta steineri]CAF0749749.1 unnamed protein product [Adineta steineri]
MNHCVRLLLLFTPSLIALGLLGIAFATNWWTIALKRNIPNENSFNISSGERIHTTLIRVPLSRGLLTECISYRNVKVLVSDTYDFRANLSSEDNLKLANENCTNDQFMCKTGVAIARPLTRCINNRQKCNRIVDCEDKSDELVCDGNIDRNDQEFFQCPTGYTKCQDRKSCYRYNEQTCDGVSNCIDDSDEMNCNTEKCLQNKRIYCPGNGKCARRENAKRCDGIVDCADYSDEDNCVECNRESSTISCDMKCLPAKYRCDDIVHCSNFSDEMNCADYTTKSNRQKKLTYDGQPCIEQHFNPFRFFPSVIDKALLESYSHPDQRIEYLNSIFYLNLIVFYGIAGGLIFLLLAVVSLFFFGYCRRHCIVVPFYFYGVWMLLAWLCILVGLISFVFIWLWQKQTVLDEEKSLTTDIMIHERNPTLRHIEFFGLSFWLACGAALSTFIGLLLSYCICCTVGSSRADDKEYEIMHMHSY